MYFSSFLFSFGLRFLFFVLEFSVFLFYFNVGIYIRVRVFYNIILALLLKLASSGSLLVQTIYIVSGIIAMLVTLST